MTLGFSREQVREWLETSNSRQSRYCTGSSFDWRLHCDIISELSWDLLTSLLINLIKSAALCRIVKRRYFRTEMIAHIACCQLVFLIWSTELFDILFCSFELLSLECNPCHCYRLLLTKPRRWLNWAMMSVSSCQNHRYATGRISAWDTNSTTLIWFDLIWFGE